MKYDDETRGKINWAFWAYLMEEYAKKLLTELFTSVTEPGAILELVYQLFRLRSFSDTTYMEENWKDVVQALKMSGKIEQAFQYNKLSGKAKGEAFRALKMIDNGLAQKLLSVVQEGTSDSTAQDAKNTQPKSISDVGIRAKRSCL